MLPDLQSADCTHCTSKDLHMSRTAFLFDMLHKCILCCCHYSVRSLCCATVKRLLTRLEAQPKQGVTSSWSGSESPQSGILFGYVFQPVSARPGAQCSGRITPHVAPPEGSCTSLSTCLQDGRPGVPTPPACAAGPELPWRSITMICLPCLPAAMVDVEQPASASTAKVRTCRSPNGRSKLRKQLFTRATAQLPT